MKLHPILLAALLVPGFAVPSQADLLFSNLGQSEDGASGPNTLDERIATDFLTDGLPRTITGITAKLSNSSTVLPLSISFSIYTDTGSGSPDALLGAFDAPVVVPPNSNSSPFGATSTGINLQANTPYWVVGQLNAPESLGTLSWPFDSENGTDGGPFATVTTTSVKRNAGSLWVNTLTGNLIFSLEGSETPIPEASALPVVLTAGAFVAIGWWRRKRVARGGLSGRGPAI